MRNKIITTEDGSKTIFVPSLDENYHSRHGAIQESKHIFINSGLKNIDTREIKIFELGFGTGLNAFLTALESISLDIKISYTSIEKYPLSSSMILELNYAELLGTDKQELFDSIHKSEWNSYHKINGNFSLRKIEGDIKSYTCDESYDLIYFDAFGPDKQPDMWTDSIISKITDACNKGALFVTYSARGELKRQLKGRRFRVEHPPGPPGKREITRAVKY